MNEVQQKKIFSTNLKHYVEKTGKQQKEIAKALGISYTTFNTWIHGRAMPSSATIQNLADYFHIMKSALLDEHDYDSISGDNAMEIGNDPDMQILYHIKQNMDQASFEVLMEYIKKMYKINHPDDKLIK